MYRTSHEHLHICFGISLAIAICSIGVFEATAQTQTVNSQGSTVAGFLVSPSTLLQRFQNGGPDFASQIRDLAVADAATVPVILKLLAAANPAQKRAVGQGLADAAKLIVKIDQARAVEIQQRVAAIADPVTRVAFIGALGDIQLGGIGVGAGGGAGGGIGGQTLTLPITTRGSSSVQDIRSSSFATPNFTYVPSTSSVSGGSSGGSSRSSTGATFTGRSRVSP